jgi:hypothetical protein
MFDVRMITNGGQVGVSNRRRRLLGEVDGPQWLALKAVSSAGIPESAAAAVFRRPLAIATPQLATAGLQWWSTSLFGVQIPDTVHNIAVR